MSTSLEQIRAALLPFLSDQTGGVDLPEDFLEMLENADTNASYKAEVMEGLLALYAGNKISKQILRERLASEAFQIVVLDTLRLGSSASSAEPVETNASSTTLRRDLLVLLGTSQVGTESALERERAV
jgi:hypothetical protein